MLPRHQRLTSAEVRLVLKTGTKTYSSGVTLRRIDTKTKKCFGIIVSKRVYKTARNRNTLRRKVYVFLREHIDAIQPGLYVISVSNDDDKARLKESLKRLLVREPVQ